jgi:hypothetical protein
MQAFEALLARVASALERHAISYMVIGGQAVLIHGKPRFTGDIDITLGIDTDRSEQIFMISRELSLTPRKYATMEFVRRNALLRVMDEQTGIAVDFMFSFLPYERQAIERAQSINIGQATVRFSTAEDTIIHKLFAGRPLDTVDVKGIVNETKVLDTTYIRKWLKDFSLVAARDLVKEYDDIEAEVRGR